MRICRERVAILAGLACCAFPVCAGEVSAPSLKTIVVTGKTIVPDAEVKRQVETAMRSDPFFYDEHVTVTIKDGVVTLQGMVFDEWDMRVALRISRKVAGVKRVINELDIKLGGE
jgi:osmotically-inducible protein OsmY